MAIKNVTPARGAKSKSAVRQDETYQPRFKSDKAQPRSRGGRGNERVTNEDVSGVAEQATTTRWDKLPNAIEYLRRFVSDKSVDPMAEQTIKVVGQLVECLRAYNEALEQLVRNDKKTLTPMAALRLMDRLYRHKELVSDAIKSPAEKMYDISRFTVVPEVFADNDITTLTLEGIGRCNIMDDIGVTMAGDSKEEKEANKLAFYEWLRQNELEDLITQTVNAQTLAAFVRRQIQSKDGLKLPYDRIKVTPVTRAQITRS
jgi:hypothetical protein